MKFLLISITILLLHVVSSTPQFTEEELEKYHDEIGCFHFGMQFLQQFNKNIELNAYLEHVPAHMRHFYTIAGGFLECMLLPKEFKDFHYKRFIERKPAIVEK